MWTKAIMFALVLLMAMLPLANTVFLRSGGPLATEGRDQVHEFIVGAGHKLEAELDDIEPALTPKQFLMISSPTEKKIVWTTLKNLESGEGRAYALVDSGLSEPKGLAFDHKRGHLYVADSGAQKIFRYTVLADVSGADPKLTTSGVRLTITQGHPVDYVTLDDTGNLFYTAPDTNNINKIPAAVMDKVAKGEFRPMSLQIVSEKVLEAKQAAAKALAAKKRANESNPLPTDAPNIHPHIYSMYEAKLNPHVSQPASVWADGPDLYWTNTREGLTAGTVVKGQVDPQSNSSKNGPAPFPAVAITNVSAGAYYLCKSEKVMFFTRNGTLPNTGLVTGLLEGPNILIDFVQKLQKPRGLVWDKDQTMYVADEGNGAVWSFPAGRMMANAPLTKTVTMKGAYGLVLLSSKDPAFTTNSVTPEAQQASSQLNVAAVQVTGSDAAGASASQAPASLLQRRDDLKSLAHGSSALTSVVALASIAALLI